MIPTPVVRKVDPLEPTCRSCGGICHLIEDDGPPVCLHCIKEAGVMGQATVRRNDTPFDHLGHARRAVDMARKVWEAEHWNREGQWP